MRRADFFIDRCRRLDGQFRDRLRRRLQVAIAGFDQRLALILAANGGKAAGEIDGESTLGRSAFAAALAGVADAAGAGIAEISGVTVGSGVALLPIASVSLRLAMTVLRKDLFTNR